MKKKTLIYLLGSLALTFVVSSSLIVAANQKSSQVDGYSVTSLPTTIDLNDSTESEIRSYYSTLNSKLESERKGTNLLKNLKTILKNNQNYFSYDSGDTVWKMYEITDRDWVKSPASSISGYNSTTNKITGYSYNSTDPYIHALYINRNVTNQTTAWSDHNQDQWGINREHVWPKAEGFDKSGAGGARGDPMHLMAGNGYANNIHSNYYYGYVKTSSSYTDCGTKYSNQSGNLRGTSKTLNTGTVFEPQDSDKGDIARAIFYMVARYNYLSGSDSDGIDTNNPNLTLTQNISDWSSSGYTSSKTTQGKMGIMTDLLAWHHADPVDQYEIHRNNLLYKNFTNNRNPFIDFPEWADFIWGSVNYNGSTYVSNDTTPTGAAMPSTDTINGYNSGSSITVTGISLNKNSTTIRVGGTEQLTATIAPSNATDKAVTWTSSNTNKATVTSDGVVTGVAAGSATITAKSHDGNYTATCTVTVSQPTLSSISISGYKTQLDKDTEFDYGGTVTANFSDSTSADVTSEATFSGYNMSTLGNQTVTVSYTYGGTTKTASYTLTIVEGSSTDEGSSDLTSSSTNVGDSAWDITGASGYYTTSGNYGVKLDATGEYIVKNPIFSDIVSSNMTILSVTVSAKINGSPTAANSYIVEALDSNGNVLNSDTKTGSTVFTTSFNTVTFNIDSSLAGCTGIRIKYLNKGAGNMSINGVSWVATYSTGTPEVKLNSIAVKTAPTKVEYVVGDDFAPAGLVITATYSDSTTEDIPYEDNEDSFEFDPIENLETTDTSVTITYGGKSCNQAITVHDAVDYITASVGEKTYHVGEIIAKSDITVTLHYLSGDTSTTTDFTFTDTDYRFVYSDANAGGTATSKTFTNAISSNSKTCSLEVSVSREAYVTPSSTTTYDLVTDESTLSEGDIIIIASTQYDYALSTEQKSNNRGAVAITKSNNQITGWETESTHVPQELTLTSSTAVSGTFGLSTGSGYLYCGTSNSLKTKSSLDSTGSFSITINANGVATISVYINTTNTRYIKYNHNNGTPLFNGYLSTSNMGTIEIYKKNSSAGANTAVNVANYIMYEDTNNQCTTKFDTAKGYFEGLTKAERVTFMESSDYVIATARERLEAWARNQGKAILADGDDYVFSGSNLHIVSLMKQTNNAPVIITVISLIGAVAGFGFYLSNRKRKGQ